MDVNEKIVLAWLNECKKMFTITNIYYGQFHSDVDVLAVDMNNHTVWDCEIKVRVNSIRLAKNDSKQNGFYRYVDSMKVKERDVKIREHLGDCDFAIEKKFITTKRFLSKKYEDWVEEFQNEGISVIFIDEIIDDLKKFASVSKRSTNEIIQTLRLYSMHE